MESETPWHSFHVVIIPDEVECHSPSHKEFHNHHIMSEPNKLIDSACLTWAASLLYSIIATYIRQTDICLHGSEKSEWNRGWVM